MNQLEKDLTVHVDQGVHGRIATGLAQIAKLYNVRLHILGKDDEIDCSSVLDVLSMGFVCGTVVKFRVQGEQAGQAVMEIERLLTTGLEQ